MKDDKMHLINKIFNNETIRTVWDKEDEKYYISVVDIIAFLTKSSRPRKYWSDLKKKIIDEGYDELSENIGQLKLKSNDGKYYNTDENIEVARRGGKIANNTRKDLETELGESVITQNNVLNYKYINDTNQIK